MEPRPELVASYPALLVAMGACATAGLFHLWFWMRGRERAAHLWVAAWCGIALVFQAARAAQLQATEPPAAIAAARVQVAAAPLLVLSLLAFAHTLRRGRFRALPVALVLAGNAALVALALGTELLMTFETYPRVDWFGQTYLATRGEPWLGGLLVYALAACVYGGYAIRSAPGFEPRERAALLGGVALYGGTGLFSVLSAMELVELPMLVEYSPAVVAFGFTYLLVHRHERLQRDLQALVDARTAEIEAANARLAESEGRYRRLVEDAPLGVVACDREGRILAVNSYLVRLIGSPSAEATKQVNVLTDRSLQETGASDLVRRTLEYGGPESAEFPYESLWGRRVEIRVHVAALRDAEGRITGAQAIVEDMEERRRLEERLRRSQRLEAVGQLAAGLAHEINNPMAYVRSNLGVLRQEWETLRKAVGDAGLAEELCRRVADCEELIDESLEGVDRTVAIVRDVKEFSREEGAARTAVDPNGLVEDALRMALPQRGAEIRVDERYGTVPPVLGSAGQLRQVFLNLAVNAFHAVAERPGAGWVRVETRAEPNRVVVALEDDGCGIPEAARARLFDPFFTTKRAGEGTGLGLYISYEIVRMHGGEIGVDSRPGEGTRFEVRLPAAQREPGGAGGSAAGSAGAS